MKRPVAVLSMVLLSSSLWAAKTTTWQGAAGAAWNAAGNWTDGKPESGDTVVLTGTSSVNDIAGLELVSLQFTGDASVTLSGEEITLAAGETSLKVSGAGTFTVAAPLVLSEGDNTFDIGDAATLELTGAISGEGGLRFKGKNSVGATSVVAITGETATLKGAAKLRIANTYAGGTKIAGAHVEVFDYGCFGSSGLAFEANGSYVNCLFLRAAGTFATAITAIGSSTQILNSEVVELTGDITETTTSTTLYLGTGIKNNVKRDMTFRGTVNIPNVTVESYAFNDVHAYYGVVTAKAFKGNGGATGGTAKVWLYNPANAIGKFNGSGSVELHCGETNVVRGLTVGWSGFVGGSEVYLDGKDQEMGDFAFAVLKVGSPNYLSAEWWTKMSQLCIHSSSAATLTMKATKDQLTSVGLDANVSFVYDPTGDFELTMVSNRTHKMTGLLAARRGTLKVTGFATFKDATGVGVSSGATMDFSEETVDPFTDRQVDFTLETGATLVLRPDATWTVKTLVLDGTKVNPGVYTHAELPELADNGGTLVVPFAGGTYVYDEPATVPVGEISGDNRVIVNEGATVTFEEEPVRSGDATFEVTGTGAVVCDAAKGTAYGVWLMLNGLTAQFNGETGVLEYNDYSTAGDSALVQNSKEPVTEDLDGATRSVDAVARLAETGDYTVRNGTVSASGAELVLENRDADGEIAIKAVFSPGTALLRKLGAGLVTLPSDSSWSSTAQLDAGALAVETATGRLVVSADEPKAQVKLSAADGAASVVNVGATVRLTTDPAATVNRLDVAPTESDVSAKTTVRGATLAFAGTGAGIAVGNAASENATGLAELDLTNTTAVLDNSLGSMQVASRYGDGIVRIQAGAVVSNKVYTGHYGHVGALQVCGGRLFSNAPVFCGTGGGSKMGSGYVEVREGGEIEMTGEAYFAGNSYNDAILDVRDGAVRYRVVDGMATYYRFIACGSSGRVDIRIGRNGVLDVTNAPNCWLDGAFAGQMTMTARDGGLVDLPEIYLHRCNLNRTGDASQYENTIFNAVDGGICRFGGFAAYTGAMRKTEDFDPETHERLRYKVFVNLNGGTWVGANRNALYRANDNASFGFQPRFIERVIVYAKGGRMKTEVNVTSHTPIVPATGLGVVEIPWTAQGGFVGAPMVKIEGDGEAASASALFDSASGMVTNIAINAPGVDYTWATAVVTRAGGTAKGDVIARIPCTLAPNADGPLVLENSGGAQLAFTAPVSVSEIVISSNMYVQVNAADCISSNTLVTLNSGTVRLTDGGGASTTHHHFAPKAYRGKGSFAWQWENSIYVSGFPVEGAPEMSFGGITNNLENTWIVDCKAYAERKAAGLATENYPALVNITDGAKIKFVNTQYLDPDDRAYTLLTVSGSSGKLNYEILGDLPEIAADSEPLASWKLVKTGNSIRLKHVRGMMMIVR